ncbi:MAG: hypothetical protein ACREQJ_13920 [Candidatus Binatia bacterium]
MTNRSLAWLLIALPSACGGGDGGSQVTTPKFLEGTWSGDLQLGGQQCGGGGFIGAGSGAFFRVATISINGGDAPGDEVRLLDDDCEYVGRRPLANEIDPVFGESISLESAACNATASLSGIEPEALFYQYGVRVDPAQPLVCHPRPNGRLERIDGAEGGS